MKLKNILIVVFGNTGTEPEALRQTLECFNFFVATKYIGRPRDFIDILGNNLPFDPDCLILSCHGDNGQIVMPILGEEVYEKEEPQGNFSSEEIRKYINLTGKVILNLGCATGNPAMAEAFSENNVYIAPKDDVDGNSALLFAIQLFYEIAQNKKTVFDAYCSAKGIDRETALFDFVNNNAIP